MKLTEGLRGLCRLIETDNWAEARKLFAAIRSERQDAFSCLAVGQKFLLVSVERSEMICEITIEEIRNEADFPGVLVGNGTTRWMVCYENAVDHILEGGWIKKEAENETNM